MGDIKRIVGHLSWDDRRGREVVLLPEICAGETVIIIRVMRTLLRWLRVEGEGGYVWRWRRAGHNDEGGCREYEWVVTRKRKVEDGD